MAFVDRVCLQTCGKSANCNKCSITGSRFAKLPRKSTFHYAQRMLSALEIVVAINNAASGAALVGKPGLANVDQVLTEAYRS